MSARRRQVSTVGELVDAYAALGVVTGAFLEVDGRRVRAIRVDGTPGVDQTVHLELEVHA